MQTHLEAAKVEHKKEVEQLNNDLTQKLEKLKADHATLSPQKDPYTKATYLSSPGKVDSTSVSYKEEIIRVEMKLNEALSTLAKRIDSSYDSKFEELRTSLSKELLLQSSKLNELTSEVNGPLGKVSNVEYDLQTVKTQASSAQQA